MAMHLVFGAGLIGGYVGASMLLAGENVRLIVRPAVKHKLSLGLELSDYLGNCARVDEVPFVEDNIDTKPDYLWLTVKCTSVATAVAELARWIGPKTIILCCQNGLGSEQPVKLAYPDNPVSRVMVPFNVTELNAGKLHRGSEGNLTLELLPQADLSGLIAGIKSALLPMDVTSDMDALLWAKLQLNLSNSVNALANIPVKAMLEQRGYRLVIAAMMRELLAVTKARNISLPKLTAVPALWLPGLSSLPTAIFRLLANKMLNIDPNVRTSMWWDIENGKRTEIDYLNGAVVDYAEELGLSVPVNKKIIALIKQLEQNTEERRPSYSDKELVSLLD